MPRAAAAHHAAEGQGPRIGSVACPSAESYIRSALAPSTRATYDTAVEAFRRWRDSRNIKERDGPITAQEALTWLASLADRGGVSARTIVAYKCGLHKQAQFEAHPDSTLPNPLDTPLIKNLLLGIANVKRAAQEPAAPKDSALTFGTVMLLEDSKVYTASARDTMLFAAVAFGVAAAARPSEMLGSAKVGGRDRALQARQVRFFADDAAEIELHLDAPDDVSPALCELRLFVTKTHKLGETKIISAPTAVSALWRWLRLSRPAPHSLIFTNNGRPLSAFALMADLRRRLTNIGLGAMASTVTAKCFRRGGASTLAGLGLAGSDIAAAAWAPGSSMWQLYANDPKVKRARAIQINRLMQSDVRAAASAGPAAASSSARPGLR